MIDHRQDHLYISKIGPSMEPWETPALTSAQE